MIWNARQKKKKKHARVGCGCMQTSRRCGFIVPTVWTGVPQQPHHLFHQKKEKKNREKRKKSRRLFPRRLLKEAWCSAGPLRGGTEDRCSTPNMAQAFPVWFVHWRLLLGNKQHSCEKLNSLSRCPQALQLPWNALKKVWEPLGEVWGDLCFADSKYYFKKVDIITTGTGKGSILKQDIKNMSCPWPWVTHVVKKRNQPIGAGN